MASGSRNGISRPQAALPYPLGRIGPVVWATAIAARTSRLRVGTVLVLPLGHPVRMAEEIATLDNISQGRVDLGIGRSSFPRSYDGYDIPYAESRDRFEEFLQVMRLAFTQERFSYTGKYYTFRDVCMIPKPYQEPHPPLRAAATTRETFTVMGRLLPSLRVWLSGHVRCRSGAPRLSDSLA